MILHSISLQNFRIHADTAVVFPETGVVGLLGANESGKSSLLEAAAFSIFGAGALRGTKRGLRWNRALARNVASVTLEFSIGGRRYRIERSESDARLFEGGAATPIAAGISAVDEQAPSLLGMTLAEFETSFMCRQRDLQRLASMGPTERRQLILRLLGISLIDDALAGCRARKNDLGREHAGVQAGLGERDTLAEEYSTAGLDYEERRDKARAAAEASEAAEAAVPRAEAALAPLEAGRKRYEELSGQQVALGRDVQTAEKEVARLRARLEESGLADLVPDSELEAARAALREAKDASIAAQADVEAARVRYESAREARRLGQVQSQTAAKSYREHALELDEKRDRIRMLGPAEPCPTCARPLGDHLEQVIDSLEEDAAVARGRAREADDRAEAKSHPSDAEMELEAAVDAQRQRLDELAAAVNDAGERLQELERRQNAALALASTRADLETWESKRDEARQNVTRIHEQLVELAFDEEAYEGAYADREHARARAAEAKSAAAAASSNLESAEERRERAWKALANYDRRAAQLEALAAKLRTHERAAEVLAEFRADRAASIRPDLEELASGFVQLLTDGRHEGMVLDDDFNAVLLEGGLEIEVASGGTEDVAALAMRLAVSQLIAERAGHPLSLLVLDEPFGSLDATRRANVMALIRRLSGVFSQVLVISHVEELQESVDQAIVLEYDEAAGATRVLERDERRAVA